MPRKKVNFVKTKKVKKGDFKGLQKGVKSKKMSEKRALKKQEKGQGFISKVYGGNPIEMSPYKIESAGQEKYNLMHDNPVAKHASWMSKHSQSAFQMGHSPAEMGHKGSPAEHKAKGHEKLEGGFKMYDKQPHTSSSHTMKPKAVAKMKYDSPAGKHCM